MTASGIRLYWDTSVFLCFLSEEEEDRRLICEDVLHAGEEGKVEIVTSMFTLVEVRGGPHPLDRFSSQLRWNPGS